jgi:hypothetical protein
MNTTAYRAVLMLMCGPWLGVCLGSERPLVHSLFTDHMVLQRAATCPGYVGRESPGKVSGQRRKRCLMYNRVSSPGTLPGHWELE